LSRFIDSESSLDSSLHLLTSTLPQNPVLFYPELVRAGTVRILSELLAHENTDIALDVVGLLVELTEEDVGEADEEKDEEEEESVMAVLVGSLVRSPLLMVLETNETLTPTLASLASSSSTSLSCSSPICRDWTRRRRRIERVSSRRLVRHRMTCRSRDAYLIIADVVTALAGIFENLLSFDPSLAETLVATTTSMKWLIDRMLVEEYDSNKQYASEVRPDTSRCRLATRVLTPTPFRPADSRDPPPAKPVKPPSAGAAQRDRRAPASALGQSCVHGTSSISKAGL
jgi:beta-catenin-like protein 1